MSRPIHRADAADCRGLVGAALDMCVEGIERFGGVEPFMGALAAWMCEQRERASTT